MKISNVRSLCAILSVIMGEPVEVFAVSWGWGSSSTTEEVEINQIVGSEAGLMPAFPTKVNSRSLETIIADERRFVLFNSRQLNGECLPICAEPAPTPRPTNNPTEGQVTTKNPTVSPTTKSPTKNPTANPTTTSPTNNPTKSPTKNPTSSPINNPTNNPTKDPTSSPTKNPTNNPTKDPTSSPTKNPTNNPTKDPTPSPTNNPTKSPTKKPTSSPTKNPTKSPTKNPTKRPTSSPTEDPTKSPTKNPTKRPTSSPTEDPTKSPIKNPTMRPTQSPTEDPTKRPSKNPTMRPTQSPTDTPTLGIEEGAMDCTKLENLGYGFSEATSMDGKEHYQGKCFPPVVSMPSNNNFPGRDDSVAVFVGGSYYGRKAAEVEGNLVVLGDLVVDQAGPGNFVSVGVGSNVIPNNDGICITVGGDITTQRDIQVFNQYSSMQCDIVYKGSATNIDMWKNGKGDKLYNLKLDLSEYEKMKSVFKKKSQFWKTLKSTGTVEFESWDSSHGQPTYTCSSRNEVQVFNIKENQRTFLQDVHTIRFSQDCKDRTILINVLGKGDVKVDAAAMYDSDGKMGHGANGFSTCMTASMLWNFPDAESVDIGNGKTSEFQGSVLVGGDLTLSTTGHSGRTIVLGDIIHNRGGSEFHSYEFNPPMPLPDPEDICVLPGSGISDGNSEGAQEAPETRSPTKYPTNSPKATTGCKAIKNNGAGANDDSCKKCNPPNNVSWWPCNNNPPACEGTECVLY